MRGAALIGSLVVMPLLAAASDYQKLEGHGGPVKSIAVNGDTALTASFDYSVGFWTLADGAPRWLEGHRAAVNTVLYLGDTQAASGGDDFAVRLWNLDTGDSVLLGRHRGKVMGLATDGTRLASASWDGSIGLWDIQQATDLGSLTGHTGNVNDVAFGTEETLYSGASDGTIREWNLKTGNHRVLLRHGFGINTLEVDTDGGWLAYGAVDGGTRVIDLETAAVLADLTLDRRPILALARRPDGGQIAVGDGEGYVMAVDTAGWSIERDFKAAVRGPIWALDYSADGTRIFAAGIDDSVSAWPLDGEVPPVPIGSVERSFLADPETMTNGERQFARKCSICHTLTPDTARRAGPSLFGIFGRTAGTLPGYTYSEALKGADFVWTDETIDKLFEIGPDHYTPGSKMPMQRIARPEDRRDLIAYLREMTGGKVQ